MTSKAKANRTLGKKVRIVIGLLSLPSIMLGAMLIKTALDGKADIIGFFESLYAIIGVFAAYISLTGKRFF